MGRRTKANGEGTVYKRKDGWAAQYHVHTANGRKRRTVYGKTRQEAAAKFAKAIADRDGGMLFDAGTTTVGEYLKSYLDDVQNRVRPKAHRRYCDLAKVHLSPTLGRIKLKDLKPDHLRSLYCACLEAGLSPRTVGHAHTLLKQCLKQAVHDGLIPRNVAESVKPPRNQKKDMRPLTPQQVRSLLC